ncbi:membrane protein [Corynebacterium phocae]|uniref:Membrane protein n=1 Tax=Corynebacterium phocae TaxID=161895 RepID=A0A1L7D0X2_9CORY|nr:DMT family transporter [Corynebacterium phocae]APT91737.1 membrane protein [Corynebacterium phocae]KAA8728501.1 hypothetical protein F4V58_00565 [Corynebacterium phocae]
MLGNLAAMGFALASALVIAWGTVVRHRIAATARGRVMRTSMANRMWWVGTGAAVVAYALQLTALSFGTLLIVQPILVLSLMFTLPLSAWYARRRMPPREIFWSIALTVAVAILVIYGRPTAGESHPEWAQWWPAFSAGAAALAGLWFIARALPRQRALALGCACGVIYGYVALTAKAVVDLYNAAGLDALLTYWEFYVLILLAGGGTVVQQYSFHAGELAQSLPAMTIMEPIVAFGLGYWVLGEKFQVEAILGWMFMALALVVMAVSTVVLSHTSTRPTK